MPQVVPILVRDSLSGGEAQCQIDSLKQRVLNSSQRLADDNAIKRRTGKDPPQ